MLSLLPASMLCAHHQYDPPPRMVFRRILGSISMETCSWQIFSFHVYAVPKEGTGGGV